MPNKSNNKKPLPDSSDAYKRAYELLFSRLSGPAKERVKAAQNNDKIKDSFVDDFVKAVIAKAEEQ